MNGVKVTNLSENELEEICREIGDSFYDYDYGRKKDRTIEYGFRKILGSRESMYQHMKACFLAGYESGCIYSTRTGERAIFSLPIKGRNCHFGVPSG